MQIDKTSCQQLLDEFGIVPNKDRGQNYLINPAVAKRIVSSLPIEETDKVLEIGPGLGSLTHYLDEKYNNLTLVDIDTNTCKVLKELYPHQNVVNVDALKYNISSYEKIISNVPYSITSDLLEYVLLNGDKMQQGVFMVQEDAYKRIVSLKGKDYGPLSVLMHLKGEIKPLFKVGPSDFYPRPNCVSIVFSISITNKYKIGKREYHAIKTLFTNRRKTLLNNLTLLTNKEKAEGYLDRLYLSTNTRPEEISPETYLKLVSLYLQ